MVDIVLANSSIDGRERQGLYRTILAGPGRSLPEAFASLEQSPEVERLIRHDKRGLLSARVTLKPEEGSGYWELSRIRSDLYVILSNFSYKDPRLELVPGDGLVQFNFKVSGDLTYGVSSLAPLRFMRPSLHVWRQPRGIDMREWTAPSAHDRTVSISVAPEFLREQFLEGDDVPPRLRPFVSNAADQIEYCQLPLTAQMLDVTANILDNPYSSALYLTYQEALIHELLCTAVGSLAALPQSPTEVYSDFELKCLRTARKLLAEQCAAVPSVRKIARLVGLSEKTLARGFKAIYGETIVDFSFRCRMQKALKLLQDDGSIDRVSEAVGYAHPTSFATAFRRHFGMRPSKMKRLKTDRIIHPSELDKSGSEQQ